MTRASVDLTPSLFWRLVVASGVRADTVTLSAALFGGGASIWVTLGRLVLDGCLALAATILGRPRAPFAEVSGHGHGHVR
jgi:hypothetical protein